MQDHIPNPIQPQLPLDEVHFITLGKNAVDITGQRFARLVVLGPVDRANNRQIMWLCQCDCGNTSTVAGNDLRSLHSQSCGCFQSERRSEIRTTHGLSNDPLYVRWCKIIDRCTCPTSDAYANYGGRGISICDEWRHDFKAFHDCVSQLAHYGEKGYTLDRVDNSLGYRPGNMRWATWTEQQRNKRSNHTITFNGITKTLSDWADETGIKRRILSERLRDGWTIERALTKPPK